MDSRNEKNSLINSNNNSISYKNFNEIPHFYSTFNNFMKNKIKNGIYNENQQQNHQYNFSKLMNSLYEYNKKKSEIDLKQNNDNSKKQKLFKGISLQNFNDSSSSIKHNIFIKKNKTSSLIIKQSILNKNLNKNEKRNNSLILKEIQSLENLEKIILQLINNINKTQNYDEFFINCNEWIKEFEKIKWDNENIIIKVKRKNNEISEKEKSVNLLIMHIIISFLLMNKHNFNNYLYSEKTNKNLREIFISHHKIFLFLCYDLLLEKNYINNINNENYLLEKIRNNLPNIIYVNGKNILLDKELQLSNKKFIFELKSLLSEIKDDLNDINNLNQIDINNIFNLGSIQLIELFKKIYQSNFEKINNNNYKKNIEKNLIIQERVTRPIFNYRNKKLLKKHFLKNEKEFYKTSDNNTFNNYCQNSFINNNNLQFKTINKDFYNTSNQIYNKKKQKKDNNQIQNENENNNQTIINSSSCKKIPFSSPNFIIESNKNILNRNKNNNYNLHNEISMRNTNINDIYKIKKLNKPKLLNKINDNKPKPPYLTQNILYSKFNKKNYTLILDLDETLIKYQINDNISQKEKIIYRPGLIQFLNKVFTLFDLIIWTVGTKEYADNIIDDIEKNKKFFSFRLYREHTTYKNKIYIKDLTNLGRPLDKIIIIDDKENNFSLQRNNGILIRPFHGTKWECQNDYTLMDLSNILTKIIYDRSKDVRIGINKYKKEILQKISNINNSNFDIENQLNN